MPKKFGGGQLVESVAFDERLAVDDGFGNTIAGDWQEKYRCRVAFIAIKAGSETIMQSRLEGHPTVIMRVRRSAIADQIDTDWRARDLRRGTIYNVRSITNDNSRAVIDVLCEANVGG